MSYRLLKKGVLLLSFSVWLFSVQTAYPQAKQRQGPEAVDRRVPFGDPFILLWEGKYYAYGTHSANGIEVLISDDLLTWKVPAGVPDGLALKKSDTGADRWFWAPEVYHVNGKFYLFYSANEHICVATADSPLGPFVQETG